MKKSCILIGEDNLLIESGNLLLQRHYTIKGVVSVFESIKAWCRKESISCYSSIDEYIHLHQDSVDYLFSIVNSTILKPEHLSCVKKAAFNYHDSLLPSYAGLNATVWSILNNEILHGITWHLINDSIDAGHIVYQKEFPSEGETVLNLNLRCFEEAIIGLTKILDDIEFNNLQPYKQSEINRSYFGKAHVLPNLGFINWNDTGEVIHCFYRACAHGHYDNKVGTLKLALNDSYLIVSTMELTDHHVAGVPVGEIISISNSGIEVATSSFSVIINACQLPTGQTLNVFDFVKQYNLSVGFRFGSHDTELLQKLASPYGRALINDVFWLGQFKQVVDHNIFSERAYAKQSKMKKFATVSFKHYEHIFKEYNSLEYFVVFVFIYLYRLNDYDACSCFLSQPVTQDSLSLANQLFGKKRPLVGQFKANDRISDVLVMVKNQLSKVTQETPYLSDLFVRYPELEEISIEPVVSLGLSGNDVNALTSSILHFELDEKTLDITMFHKIDVDYQDGELKPLLLHMPEHLSKIIELVFENDQTSLNQFELISDIERKQLYSWGEGAIRALPSDSIHELFKKQVRLRPKSPAIYANGAIVTYEDLFEQSERISSYIKSLSVPPQTSFAIYMSRSKEMLVAVLGVLSAGCIYVPLDKKYPMNKIDLILNTAEIHYILSTDECAEPLKSYYKDNDTIKISILSEILSRTTLDENDSPPDVNEQAMAYIMFTSGTTGTPKGVMISNNNVINYCYWFTQTTAFNEHSIIDFSSSLAFDLSIPCTLAPLMFGGSLTVCADYQKMNPELYLAYLKDNKITHTELTPGYLEMLLHYPDEIKKLHHLRYLLLGADTVHTEDVKKWMALCPDCQVVNEYGPTETTVSVTSYFVQSIDSLTAAVVPIGTPAFNSTSYLFDKYMNLCPVGMKGELFIGGKQVALGYLNRPDLTEEKFIPVTFNGKDVLYKTGDLACWLPRGSLQFFGRNDHQVKIHGYRVELPAIEAVLMSHDQITQAVVVIRKQKTNNAFLRAYLVINECSLTSNEIRQFLTEHLPPYMHPKELCVVDSIPLKENEKINFDLLETQHNLLLSTEPMLEPHDLSPTERTVLSCWQGAFHLKTIQIDDDFFSLGGDSLIALHVISQLKSKIHQDIHLSLLFKYPTIKALAAHLEETKDASCINEVYEKKSCLILLSSGDNKTPLFLIHPVGGTVFWYQHLANEMQGLLTIYGVEDACINNRDLHFSSFEAMASYYVDVLLTDYSEETVYLGGASFGANLAFEMAHQLIARGKKIGFLGLFDGWVTYPESLMQYNTVDQLIQNKSELLSRDSEYLRALEDHRRVLLQNYKMTSLTSDACLFKANELWPQFAECNVYDNGWAEYVNGVVAINAVPGNHETMLQSSNVMVLAELIKNNLIK